MIDIFQNMDRHLQEATERAFCGTSTFDAPEPEPLTVEKLRAVQKDLQKRFVRPLFRGAFRTVVSHHWPQVEDGTRTERFKAHLIIQWLARWFPIKPYIEATFINYRDADPMIFDGTLFMSPAQEAALKAKMSDQSPEGEG